MITLREAFRLCRIGDKEIVHFCDSAEKERCWSQPLTGREVKNQYDMKSTMVTTIIPYFCCGEYSGFAFVIKKKEEK